MTRLSNKTSKGDFFSEESIRRDEVTSLRERRALMRLPIEQRRKIRKDA